MEKIKHSVIVITYNQEHLLPTALDSLFSQSVLPYEVIIGDDCSTDGTWDVIQEYYKKYPNIVRPIRNQYNMGIFQNINYLKKKPTGDVVSFLSGDDWYEDGIFEAFNDAIAENHIDVKKDNFLLISNCIFQYPDGRRVVYNNIPFKGKDLFKVKIRYGLDFRDTGMSLNLVKQLDDIPLNLGYHADWLHAIGQIYKASDIYFINKAFSVYRIGYGVTSGLKNQSLLNSKIQVINRIKELYKKELDKNDLISLEYDSEIAKLYLSRSDTSFSFLIRNYNRIISDDLLCEQQRKNIRRILWYGIRNYFLKKIHMYDMLKSLKKRIK